MDLKNELRAARPRLSDVSPLTVRNLLGFSALNILLGMALFSMQGTFAGNIVIVGALLNYQFWGVLFFVLGAVMLWSFITNDWKLMRHTILIGVFFKSVWMFALIVRFVTGDVTNPIILILWGFLMYLQSQTYAYFLPSTSLDKGAKK